MAILKGHKMAPGLDPGCIITIIARAVGTFRIVRYIVGVRYSGVSVKQGSIVCHFIYMYVTISNLYMSS